MCQCVAELQGEGAVKVTKEAVKGPVRPEARRGMFTLNSRDLMMWVSRNHQKDDFIPECHVQVESGSASLLDSVAFETEEQTLEREQDERNVHPLCVCARAKHAELAIYTEKVYLG